MAEKSERHGVFGTAIGGAHGDLSDIIGWAANPQLGDDHQAETPAVSLGLANLTSGEQQIGRRSDERRTRST